jgi:hypothetical protein
MGTINVIKKHIESNLVIEENEIGSILNSKGRLTFDLSY